MKIKNNVEWVGKVDWELRSFHGNEYSTHRGTTYNAYLVKEEKSVLIDTVWLPYAREFIQKLEKIIRPADIDYIIINHAEVDHSGALPDLMNLIPETPIYCTRAAIRSIKGHYHKDWNFVPVKTGDSIDIGNGKSISFIEMKMLHWPDSMASYLTKDNILFSNDFFGQHYASEYLYNDLVDQCELWDEGLKYYANIFAPYDKLVGKKIDEILTLKLPIDMIATSHGIIWRKNPKKIIDKYLEWSASYQENQITIIYDTMWEGTRKMAEAIGEGIKREGKEVTIKLYNASKTDKNDLITEIFKSKFVLVGSPTVNGGLLTSIAGLLEEIRGLNFKNKKAVAFGAYGWSGESVKIISKLMEKSGFKIVDPGVKALWNPDNDAINECVELGRKIVLENC